MSERIQKSLANKGIASRRQIEEWIKAGRISINGKLAQLGDRISNEDVIRIDGKKVHSTAKATSISRVIIYNKPEGELCTRSDPEGRSTIFERIKDPKNSRWIIVGRLDINSSGLLLLTTDGELANRLMHPSYEIEREYAARVLGKVDKKMLDRLENGVMLEDGMGSFNSIHDAGGTGTNHWYHVMLSEGRNREVRRLWESQGVRVSRLKRIRYGPIHLNKGLRLGQWEELDQDKVSSLYQLTGLSQAVMTRQKKTPVKRKRLKLKV